MAFAIDNRKSITMEAKTEAKLVKRAKALTITLMILGTAMLGSVYYSTLIRFVGATGAHDKIVWIEGHENWQIYIVVAHLLTTTLLYVLGGIFLIRINRNISKGVPLPKNNFPVIIAAGILAPFAESYSDTVRNAFAGEFVNALDGTGIFAMLLLFLFATLYKFASLASEDSSLAI